MSVKNEFGAAFRTARRARGLTQEDFVEESGRTYISELERGTKHPTVAKIDGLAPLLNVHPLTVLALSYLQGNGSPAACEKLLAQVRSELEEILRP